MNPLRIKAILFVLSCELLIITTACVKNNTKASNKKSNITQPDSYNFLSIPAPGPCFRSNTKPSEKVSDQQYFYIQSKEWPYHEMVIMY